MKHLRSRYGDNAMVVGAAEGLGAAFSTILASLGFNLVLVDNNGEALEKTSEELRRKYRVNVECVLCDLNDAGSADVTFNSWAAHNCRFLIYNASYGPVRKFLKNSEEQIDRYINVNLRTATILVRKILQTAGQHRTGIMLLSSMAGFRGTRFVIPYAATKAYLWNFLEGCHYEYEDEPYDFSICCPGATATPNYLSTKPKKTALSPQAAPPEDVAAEALRKFGRQLFIVTGTSNKFFHYFISRILPRRWVTRLHNKVMKKMYG